ncbi:MAG: Spy/CpxP family protein refolding chaperone [Gemmatimonadaceae bacterium]
MLARSFAVALMLLVPVIADAQPPGGGMRRPGMGRGGGRMGGEQGSPRVFPTAEDLAKQNPVAFLIGKREELKLSDGQVTWLTQIDSALVEKNGPLLHAVDSLRGEMRPPAGDPRSMSDAEREQFRNRRRAMGDLVDGVRDNNQAAVKEALALLTDEQRKRATKLLDEQREEAERAMRGRGSG